MVVPLKKFPANQRFVTVAGDPTKPARQYVIRIHAEAGYIIMPHTHPEDENIVVVKGRWAVGIGERFCRRALEPMEVGTYEFVPKKTAHFALSITETILHVHGIGPFTTQWLVPVHKLTVQGVFLETSGSEPGHAMPAGPTGCFALSLGTRVRGSYGEGVVVEAQCTPGQLTQYRVETSNSDYFWAQRDEIELL